MDYYIQTPEQLGAALRSQRKQLKISQKSAAAQVGLLPKTISNLENNTITSSIESMFKLLSSLGMKITLTPKSSDDPHIKDLEW
jgi:HTH-type transcriptional regulator / antitoxin HipB